MVVSSFLSSTVSRAVFTSAWIDFCQTSEGRHEYWRRFGDYLFQSPPREIPRELLSLPPYTLRARSRRPASRKPSLAHLVAKARRLGVDVTVEPNGAVTFRTGSTTTAADEHPQTELDEWIAKHAH